MKGMLETNLKEKQEEIMIAGLYEAKPTAGKPNPCIDADFLEIHLLNIHSS